MARDSRQLFATAAVLAALFFGIAGVLGATGYLVLALSLAAQRQE